MPHCYEVDHVCLAPTMPDALVDADADGLTNLTEYGVGTDPCATDTDGDGYFDNGIDVDGGGAGAPNDNCPLAANPLQENNDATAQNGVYLHSSIGDYSNPLSDSDGDACDDDDDNDTILDTDEINGYTVQFTGSSFSCGAGGTTVGEDATNMVVVPDAHFDPDIDDDGARDGEECAAGSDPTNSLSMSSAGCMADAGWDAAHLGGGACRVSVPERCPGSMAWVYANGVGLDGDEDRDGLANEGCPALDADGDLRHDVDEPAPCLGDNDCDDDSDVGASPALVDGVEVIYIGTSPQGTDSDGDTCVDQIEALDVGGGTASDPNYRVSATDAGVIYAAANYNMTVGVNAGYNATFDLNHDGRVSATDAGIVYSVAFYNKRCSDFTP